MTEPTTNQIEHSVLAEAYEELLAKEFTNRPNPFLLTSNGPKVKRSANRATHTIGAVGKRIKPRKRKVSISDVLSTR